jgi:hypothetical protein
MKGKCVGCLCCGILSALCSGVGFLFCAASSSAINRSPTIFGYTCASCRHLCGGNGYLGGDSQITVSG